MALPVAPSFVEQIGALTPSLFNFSTQSDLDALVQDKVLRADAWMRIHLGNNYNLADAYSLLLQEEGQAYLALDRLADILKAQKAYGTHFPYMSEDTPAYQQLIEMNWGERAMAALDTWVTVEIGGGRAFALPQFMPSSGIDPVNDPSVDPMTIQYSKELDFARGISVPDVGTVRR